MIENELVPDAKRTATWEMCRRTTPVSGVLWLAHADFQFAAQSDDIYLNCPRNCEEAMTCRNKVSGTFSFLHYWALHNLIVLVKRCQIE